MADRRHLQLVAGGRCPATHPTRGDRCTLPRHATRMHAAAPADAPPYIWHTHAAEGAL